MRQGLLVLALATVISPARAKSTEIMLDVDARDTLRGIQHSHVTIPVHRGPLALEYAKWIPGEQAANGPITQLVSLHMTAAGKPLTWRRDSADAFVFHIDVPSGIDAIEADFDYLSPPRSFADGFGRTRNVTPHLMALLFNHFLLYPRDAPTASLVVRATVHIPLGWQFDSAIRPVSVTGGTLTMPATPLERLVDSPLLAGEYFRTIPLSAGDDDIRISIAAESQDDLRLPESTIHAIGALPLEADALFGTRHFRGYVWLVALSNNLEQNGVEHHESTDVRDQEDLFTNPARWLESRVIPHEFVHSWNGKYRRPVGLATGNYHTPMTSDLLWSYEGMTRYLGDLVLRTRSGLSNYEQARDYLAWVAALMDRDRPGRSWRSIADTATAQASFNEAPPEWGAVRRKRDYYEEMLLVWLEADVLIRQSTDGKRSFDDFCRSFFGGRDAFDPVVRTYTRGDLIKALTAVAPLDWESFISSRVDTVNERAPLGGIEKGGWKLSYDDVPNGFQTAREKVENIDNFSLSLGLWTKPDGTVVDVAPGSPAFDAGVGPGARILAIDGHRWIAAAARDALVSAETSPGQMQLIFQTDDVVRVAALNYHHGLQNPHLVKDPAKPDLLGQVLAPNTSATHN